MEVTEWGELLKPWLSALRRAELRQPDLPALPKVSDVHKTWFHVSAPYGDRNNARVWRLLGEAMQLVDLLARVDNKAAWYLMLGLVDRSAMALQYAELLFASTEEPILPKFVIEIVEIVLADKDEGHNIRQGIMRMLVKNEMPPSANFEKMKQILLDKWARAHFGEVFSREKRGRVRASLHVQVDMQLEDEDDVRNLFRHLKTLAVAQADQSTTVLDECGNDMDCNDDGEEDVGIDENDEDDDDSDDDEEDEDPEHPEEHPEEDEADENEEKNACGEAIDYNEEDDGTEENISDHEDTSSTTIIPRVRGSIELVSFRILILSNSPVTNLVLRYINKSRLQGFASHISHLRLSTTRSCMPIPSMSSCKSSSSCVETLATTAESKISRLRRSNSISMALVCYPRQLHTVRAYERCRLQVRSQKLVILRIEICGGCARVCALQQRFSSQYQVRVSECGGSASFLREPNSGGAHSQSPAFAPIWRNRYRHRPTNIDGRPIGSFCRNSARQPTRRQKRVDHPHKQEIWAVPARSKQPRGRSRRVR